jgi:hypothetical protein
MYEDSEKQVGMPETMDMHAPHLQLDIPDQDDRYPGSFFRIPGVPIPGKTTWSLN